MTRYPDAVDELRHEATPGAEDAVVTPTPREDAPLLPPAANIAAVAAGGVIGALLRVAFTGAFPTLPGRFPMTTFAENVTGAFLLGLAIVVLVERRRPAGRLHPFLCTGILGSFTTFSNVSVEVAALVEAGARWLALLYPAASIAAGMAAAIMGIALGRRLLRAEAGGGGA